MGRAAPTPTANEQPFEADELFFSTTIPGALGLLGAGRPIAACVKDAPFSLDELAHGRAATRTPRRTSDAARFRVLFAQIRAEVDGAAADLRQLSELAERAAAASAGRRLDRLADRTLRHAA